MKTKNVHTEHCCKQHGCKYGEEDCSVSNGILEQSYKCEMCDYDLEEAQKRCKYYFSLLSDEERKDIMWLYCKNCGAIDDNGISTNDCQCNE